MGRGREWHLETGSITETGDRSWVQGLLTGLLCDKTPTAGSQGLFNRRDRASAPAAPVLVVEDRSILSIRVGI